MKSYEYVIVGAGIAGCSMAYFLSKAKKRVLLVDKLDDPSKNASATAGGFLSPLLGKPNEFKTLVTDALSFSIPFYQKNFSALLTQKGVWRIPKDRSDASKLESYIPHMDFEYELRKKGCYFPIGAQVDTGKLCKQMSKNCDKLFNYKIKHIQYQEGFYCLNDDIKCENLIVTTGADVSLIGEQYFNIRAVWGQRIDIQTSTCIDINYHKACSISTSKPIKGTAYNKVSIGATHHRIQSTKEQNSAMLDDPSLEHFKHFSRDDNIIKSNTDILLKRAQDILALNDVKVLKQRVGARASSPDYFPIIGPLIDSKKTLNMFPYIQNGTPVPSERFTKYPHLYVLNGLGGRGFALAPFLAHNLSQHLLNDTPLITNTLTNRLFIRWAKRQN